MSIFVWCIVATPFAFAAWLIDRILQHRVAVHRLSAGPTPMPALAANPEVEQRLANLEAIVCSQDHELAARLRQTGNHHAA